MSPIKSLRCYFQLLASVSAVPATSARSVATWVYVSNADSQDLSVFELDRVAGALRPIASVPAGGVAMPMVVSRDKRFLYVALRSQPFRVVTFAIDGASGGLRKLGEAALADSMANIDLDASGRWLFGASYGGDKITVNSVGTDGVVGAVQQLIRTAPKAHAIHADPAGRYVFASSLGGDNLSSWRFDASTGMLSANAPALVNVTPAGTGPRHFVWDKAQKYVYLINELDGGVDVFAYDGANGGMRHTQRASAMPPGFVGKPWAADLHLSPGGAYLYASERASSTLVTFKVDLLTGCLRVIGHTPTESTPRSFAVDSSGGFLIAAGQDSHRVSLHVIDATTGIPTLGASQPAGKSPNWVEIVDF